MPFRSSSPTIRTRRAPGGTIQRAPGGPIRRPRGGWLVVPAMALLAAGCGGHAAKAELSPSSPPPAGSSTAQSSSAPAAPAPASSSTAAPAAPAGPATCQTANLTITRGPGQGAAGHEYLPLRFTNRGAACRLTGYPGVSFVAGADQHQVGVPAARETGRTIVPVTLTTGASTTATLSVSNPGNYDPGQCQPVPVSALKVFPPGETHPAFVPLDPGSMSCSTQNQTLLRVTPVGVTG